jgi:hypothetical protein
MTRRETSLRPELHADVAPLAGLLGMWIGSGRGAYPTCEPFEYDETVTITHVGKPFLGYVQRTVAPSDGRPLHGEVGFLRMPKPGRVEMVLAHPNGLVEAAEGGFDGTAIHVASTMIGRTTTAKEVSAVERDLTLEGDVLRYELRMEAVGEPMAFHLEAELHRAS